MWFSRYRECDLLMHYIISHCTLSLALPFILGLGKPPYVTSYEDNLRSLIWNIWRPTLTQYIISSYNVNWMICIFCNSKHGVCVKMCTVNIKTCAMCFVIDLSLYEVFQIGRWQNTLNSLCYCIHFNKPNENAALYMCSVNDPQGYVWK